MNRNNYIHKDYVETDYVQKDLTHTHTHTHIHIHIHALIHTHTKTHGLGIQVCLHSVRTGGWLGEGCAVPRCCHPAAAAAVGWELTGWSWWAGLEEAWSLISKITWDRFHPKFF